MKQIQIYVLDLAKTDDNGAFTCPGCGNVISPDDFNEDAYSIIEPKVNGLDLEELVIHCGKCGGQLSLTGFLCHKS